MIHSVVFSYMGDSDSWVRILFFGLIYLGLIRVLILLVGVMREIRRKDKEDDRKPDKCVGEPDKREPRIELLGCSIALRCFQ